MSSTFLLHVLTASLLMSAEFQAGAVVLDITPVQLPVVVNGGMLSRTVEQVKTRLNARALVLDDGQQRLGIVIVDSCMLPRPFLDEVKQLASRRTGIRRDRILIAATHAHSAPAGMGCLGTDADMTYLPYLRERLAQSLVAAEANLEPAKVGWAVKNAAEYTALRRWIRRPDRVEVDPFGNRTVRANMHAGRNWDDVTGESGPEDPDLALISVQAVDGRPIAVLANFAMHYFADTDLSADYFGIFCASMEKQLTTKPDNNTDYPAFVGIMSHGCSGDIWRADYTLSPESRLNVSIEEYGNQLSQIALDAYRTIEHHEDVDLAMDETRMRLDYRVPDSQRLQWARQVVEQMGDRGPENVTEVYAREQIILHELQSTEIVVQALRIGDIGIATTPNETYALTGLKIKLQSPLKHTMVIELANGGDGYIPPPEQHFLGGYNTWPARSAGLEVQAEPKITETALQLLENVARQPRRTYQQSPGLATLALLSADPIAYWRLDEFSGPTATDDSGHERFAWFEPGVVFFLEGPWSSRFCKEPETNRCAHFAGGRLRTRIPQLGKQYSVSLWFWNGMPTDARDVTGWMISRGREFGKNLESEHVGLGGSYGASGKLIFLQGSELVEDQLLTGSTTVPRWSWNHVVFVRDTDKLRIYLNGKSPPEIDAALPASSAVVLDEFFFGGRSDQHASWEGRLDEIAVFDRLLSADEVSQLFTH